MGTKNPLSRRFIQGERTRSVLPKQFFRIVHIHRQHQSDADIQHQHRAAAGRIERQGDADDGQDAQVHADVDGDLCHQRAADTGTDEAAEHILALCAGGKGLHDEGEQNAQHHAAAHKAHRVTDPTENEVVVGVRHAVIAAIEQAVAKYPTRAQRNFAALLLVDDIFPNGLTGSPAGFVLRVDDRKDTVPLIALADGVAEEGKGHCDCCTGGGDCAEDVLPADASRKHHTAADDAINNCRAIVALHMNDSNRCQQVQQKLAQFLRLVYLAPDVVQVHREGQNKAYLRKFGRLKREAAQFVPRVVIGIACVVADGDGADGDVPDEQSRQDQTPRHRHMHRPDLDEAAIVDVRQ